MLNNREQKICDKYSRIDEEGKVHCMECPLRVGTGEFDFRCKANSYYDKKTKEWILDTNNIKEKSNEHKEN